MLTQDQVDKVEAQVEAITGDKQMFTAFDVTRRLRNKGEQIRHMDVREVVHDMYRQGTIGNGYIRTLRSINQSDSAFVYHRHDHDLSEYKPYALKPRQDNDTQPAPKHDVWRNKSGRVRITRRFLENIGISAYDEVVAYPVGRAIHIKKSPITPRPFGARIYHADQYGNVRLNKIFLDRTFIEEYFNVSRAQLGDDTVILTPAT